MPLHESTKRDQLKERMGKQRKWRAGGLLFRTGGEEDEVDGGVDPASGDDVGLGGPERLLDPADGAARAPAAALPGVEPPQQDARVVDRRVPGMPRQPREDQDQHHEDDERRQKRRHERRDVHLAPAAAGAPPALSGTPGIERGV